MTEAPERMWIDPDILPSEWYKQYYCDVEYIRADLLEAARREARVEGMRAMLTHYLDGTWYRNPDAIASMRALIAAEERASGEGEP